MQVNNWPVYVALPCPWCRGKGYQTAYLVSTGHVACKECGIELPVEAWGALSRAAEVSQAVDTLEPHHAYVDRWQGTDVWMSGIRPGAVASASTLRAALIELAKQVQK